MNKLALIYGVLAIFLAACSAQSVQSTEVGETKTTKTMAIPTTQSAEVKFTAADDGTVYADLHISAQNENLPFIILFHQAGSNGRGEYANTAAKLTAKGYSLLIVDQRSGGGYYGSENRTVKARGGKTKYCDAYPDMEAALAFAKTKTDNKVFAFGSSYSAALVLKLASEHGDDLAGVISFSPATGKAMGVCNADNFIADVDIPALGIRPESEMGKGGQTQRDLYTAQGLDYYVAKDGVHGASMLDPSRAKGDVEPTWKAVWTFLEKHK